MKLYENPALYELITCWEDAKLVEQVQRMIGHGTSVLDLGIGAGRIERMLGSRDYQFSGIELRPEMVEYMGRTAPSIGVTLGSFADASSYANFADGAFDAVLCLCNTLLYVPTIEQLTSTGFHASRKTRRSGKFVVQTSLNVGESSVGKAKCWDARVRLPNSFERVVHTEWRHAYNSGPHAHYRVTITVNEAGMQTYRMVSDHRQLRVSAAELIAALRSTGWLLSKCVDSKFRELDATPVTPDTYLLEFEHAA